MTMFQGVIVFILALCLTGILWHIRCALLRRAVGGSRTRVTVVVTSEGSPSELEQSVKGLLWLMESGTLSKGASIVIRDGGMGPEAAQMAGILARENPSVTLEG